VTYVVVSCLTRLLLHGVVNGHARGHGAARRVDVQRYVRRWVFVGQIEKLRHQHICALIVHLHEFEGARECCSSHTREREAGYSDLNYLHECLREGYGL